MQRRISSADKAAILIRQNNKCANSIFQPALNLQNYQCLLWKYSDGSFDAAGPQFDHIDEFCKTLNNDINNIQALCPSCHVVKTKKFMNNKKLFTSTELNDGRAIMDVEKQKTNKRKK